MGQADSQVNLEGKKDTNSITQEENTKYTVLCYRKTHITFTILTFLIV